MNSRFKQILAILIVVVPFGLIAFLSVSERWIFPHIFPLEFSIAPWKSLLNGSGQLLKSLMLSIIISLTVAVVVTTLSFFASRQIAYSKWGQKMIWFIYFPYVFAPVLLGAILQYYFIRCSLSGNVSGVLLGQFLITFPYGLIFFLSFWNQQTRALEGLVSTLGGNALHRYIRVLIPLAKPAIALVFFQSFLISWFEYGLTMLIGVGQVQTLTIQVFQYVNSANINYAAAASLLLILPPILLLWYQRKIVMTRWQI